MDYLLSPALLVFTAPLLFGLLMAGVSIVGFLSEGHDAPAHTPDGHLPDSHWEAVTGVSLDGPADLLASFAHFLGYGLVPLTLFLTSLVFGYSLTGLLAHALTDSLLVSLPVAIVAGVFLGSRLVRLIAPLFRDYGQASTAMSLVGKVCVASTSEVSPDFGAATLRLDDGQVLTLNIRATEAHDNSQGQRFVLKEELPDGQGYLAIPME